MFNLSKIKARAISSFQLSAESLPRFRREFQLENILPPLVVGSGTFRFLPPLVVGSETFRFFHQNSNIYFVEVEARRLASFPHWLLEARRFASYSHWLLEARRFASFLHWLLEAKRFASFTKTAIYILWKWKRDVWLPSPIGCWKRDVSLLTPIGC